MRCSTRGSNPPPTVWLGRSSSNPLISPPFLVSLRWVRAAEDSARRLSSGGDELRARVGALEQESADLRKARDSLMGQLR